MSLSTAELALLGSAFVLGLRHGVDYDHIAAITDIAMVQKSPRRGAILGALYAFGHGLVVMTLGALAIALSVEVPERLDIYMSRAVGMTLVALGLLVLYSLMRSRGPSQRFPTRGLLVLHAVRAIAGMFRARRRHRHEAAPSPADYGPFSAIAVGVIHGIGAETPSQLLLFVLAAGFAGAFAGVLTVATFVAGVLATNTAMSLVLATGYGSMLRRPWVLRGVMTASAMYSLAVGVIFIGGLDTRLPGLL